LKLNFARIIKAKISIAKCISYFYFYFILFYLVLIEPELEGESGKIQEELAKLQELRDRVKVQEGGLDTRYKEQIL
jgi:hypothetical protein